MSLIGGPVVGLTDLMTMQATIQREQGTRDSLGARAKRDWQDLATSACFAWWGTGAVVTRMGSIQQRPESTIDIETGGMILPAGTDITARDQVSQILNDDETVFAVGPFEILAVAEFEGMTELSFRRIT